MKEEPQKYRVYSFFFFFSPPEFRHVRPPHRTFFVISQHILICSANLSLISWSTVVLSKNETTLLLVLFVEPSSISTDSNELMRRRPLVGGATQKMEENPLDFMTARDGQVPHRRLIESPQTPFSFQTDGGRRRGWVTGRGYHFLTRGLEFKACAKPAGSHVVSQAEGHFVKPDEAAEGHKRCHWVCVGCGGGGV